MNPTTDSLAVRVLRWLSNAVYRYPRLFFYPQLLLFVVSIAYTAMKLEFDTSRDDLVGADKPYQDRKSTRLNSSHRCISYAVFCLKKKSTARDRRLLITSSRATK